MNIFGVLSMKRDMDLIRQLVFLVEEAPAQFYSQSIELSGFTAGQIGYTG